MYNLDHSMTLSVLPNVPSNLEKLWPEEELLTLPSASILIPTADLTIPKNKLQLQSSAKHLTSFPKPLQSTLLKMPQN